MSVSRLLAAAAALALLAVPAASASIINAEDVLPAGQSGYVSLLGVSDGSGSPHLYDQVPLFTSFRWKPHGFNQPGDKETPRPGVDIVRDAYGVPAITAGGENDAWWGVGWAVAEDRLFQLELFRRATTGRLAEILGKGYLDDDLIARRDYYTRPELEKMFAALPASLQARAAAYRDGVNAYIAYLGSHPDETPGEFTALQVPLRPIELWEQAAIGVFLARTVPSGDGNELTNLRLLRENGRDALDALVPIRQKRETYTVPPSSARFPSQPGRTRKQERTGYKRSLAASRNWDLPNPKTAARARSAVAAGLPGHVGGSSMFAVRDPKTRHAYLFNGPQLGFSEPELFVEFELHYPGLDLRGVSAAGVPVMGIGHNDRLAWGFTSGLSDEDDLYAEQLAGDEKAERYRFKGAERDMECRDETFTYSTPVTDVAGGAAPESGSVTERICRTVHGPVQVRAGRTAYARRYAIWGREIETLVGIDMLNRARTVGEVDAAMRQVTWNENVMAVDSNGDIGYWHPGLHQLRPKRFDERLPYPGTGEAEWRGLRDRRTTPHVINPRQNWLANWNNLPAKGWTTGDAESAERLAGAFHRGQFLQRAVRAYARNPSFKGAQVLISHVGTTAQQRPLAEVRLRRAAAGATGRAKAVLDAIRAWDGSYHRVDGNGTVDPGVALWEELKDRLEDIALGRLGPGRAAMDALVSNPGTSHQFDISDGEAYAVRTLKLKAWRRAAETTAANLEKRFGTADVAKWREPRRMYEWELQGAGSPPDLPFFDRGTWEQFVEVGPGG
jgi:acyl-homoserine lactone acylase PvdQ